MASMRGLRAIEDFTEDFGPLVGSHRFVPTAIVGSQIMERGALVFASETLRICKEAVLLDQLGQMVAIGNES